jgi:hypothetical protein
MDAKKEAYFCSYILAWPASFRPVDEWGFAALRAGATAADAKATVLAYLERHQYFAAPLLRHGHRRPVEGVPFNCTTVLEADVTPFDRLYYVPRGLDLTPLLALRLRPNVGTNPRLAQLTYGVAATGETLALLQLLDEAEAPEQDMSLPEAVFLAHFGTVAERWV